MIGTLPIRALAPLEYRLALDAALPALATHRVLLRCDVAPLFEEARQRVPQCVAENAGAGLLVEPLRTSWRADLAAFRNLPSGAPLLVVASRPMARLLPERQGWPAALGATAGGVRALCGALGAFGFVLEGGYGFHSAPAIGFSALSGLAERAGRPELADRMLAATRGCYCSTGVFAPFATVALLCARKVGP